MTPRFAGAVALLALALFVVGMPIGMAAAGRHQPTATPAPVTCTVPATAPSVLVVIPAGVMR